MMLRTIGLRCLVRITRICVPPAAFVAIAIDVLAVAVGVVVVCCYFCSLRCLYALRTPFCLFVHIHLPVRACVVVLDLCLLLPPIVTPHR